MSNGEQAENRGNPSNAPTGVPGVAADGSNKEKAVALSELIDGMIESLKQLKNSSCSGEDLKKLGIASSFQDLPCTFDICLTVADRPLFVSEARCRIQQKGQQPDGRDAVLVRPKTLATVRDDFHGLVVAACHKGFEIACP